VTAPAEESRPRGWTIRLCVGAVKAKSSSASKEDAEIAEQKQVVGWSVQENLCYDWCHVKRAALCR
jgi:hypothetical protein